MSNLVRIVYVSEAVTAFTPAALSALLRQSQASNASRGLTGVLLSAGGQFMQVLEGPAEAVSERLTVITADPRHQRVHRFLCEPTSARLFGRWSMGLLNVEGATTIDRAALRAVIEGAGDPNRPTDRTQVHKLLANFHSQMAATKAA